MSLDTKITISVFSATDWANVDLWESVLALVENSLHIRLARYGRGSPMRLKAVSLRTVAESLVQFRRNPWSDDIPETSRWLLGFDHSRVWCVVDYPSVKDMESRDLYRQFGRFDIIIPPSVFFNNEVSATFPDFLSGLTRIFGACFALTDRFGIFAEELAPYCPHRLEHEFPTLSWINFFSNRVVDFFGRDKFAKLPCEVVEWPNGLCTKFGKSPEEADLRRTDKLRAEEILGMYSFTTPVAFPKPNYNDEDARRHAMDTDPCFGWPKLPNGDPKPRFAYVPPYWVLAEEFPRPGTPTNPHPATNAHPTTP